MYTPSKEALHFAEVRVSEALESHGIPDPYIWRFNKLGQLIPEYSDTPIEDIIVKDNYIGKIEYDAFLKIQEKASKINSGFILWISPRHPVYYPYASKIVVSEKRRGTLLNRAIVTNWDTIGSVVIARELSLLSNMDPNIFRSGVDVRANPIFIDKEKEEELSLALKKILDQKSIEMIASGKDFLAKRKYVGDLLAGRKISHGQNPLSCPTLMERPTAFQIFSGEKDQYGSLEFVCDKCHEVNTRPYGKLISNCQHCGADVKCA